MAVISDEKAAATIVQLQTRVRRAVGDTDSSTTNQRWSDAELNEAINFELMKMSSEWGLGNSSQAMKSTTLSYTANSDSVALPAGPDVNPIFMVENYTDSTNPIRIEYASFLEADKYYLDHAYMNTTGYRWSRVGTSIAIRPLSGETLTLRIWYLRAPYAFTLDGSGDEDDATDQSPWPVQHEELISLGAAIRLQEVDEEVPAGRLERYMDLWQRFVRSKSHNRGPKYVRKNRRFR